MRPSLPLAVLDYEASSLSDSSYPIEAGWALIDANLTIASSGFLIRPHHKWTDWSLKSEALHGLARGELEAEGIAVSLAAAALDKAFIGLPTPVLSADPTYEAFWSDRLFTAAGRPRGWAIGSLQLAIESELDLLQPTDRSWATASLAKPRPHRAEADARAFAEVIAELKRRQL